MGYSMQDGRFSGSREIILNALQGDTVSVDGKSAVHEVGVGTLALRLVASSVGASATCDITVETSDDGVTYYSAGTFTQVTSTAGTQNQYKVFGVGRFVRLDFNIGGSGTLDLKMTGDFKG